MPNHQIFDKRLKKPIVYSVKDIGEDITMEHLETYIVGKAKLVFRSPNVVALFLSMSEKTLKNANVIYNELIKPNVGKQKTIEYNELGNVKIFDYFEYIQTSIILLYSAIESLVNLLIPDDHIIEEITSKGIKEVWDKTAIERWKTTSEKLTKILPAALNIISPTTFQYWSVFKEFEVLRNSIIHIKKDSLINTEETKKTIGQLLNESVFKKIDAGNSLLRDLANLVPNHYEFPILNETETLIPIEINSWSDLGFERTK